MDEDTYQAILEDNDQDLHGYDENDFEKDATEIVHRIHQQTRDQVIASAKTCEDHTTSHVSGCAETLERSVIKHFQYFLVPRHEQATAANITGLADAHRSLSSHC